MTIKYSMGTCMFDTYLPCGCQARRRMKWFTHHRIPRISAVAECRDCGATWNDDDTHKMPSAPSRDEKLSQYKRVVKVAQWYYKSYHDELKDPSAWSNLLDAVTVFNAWETSCKTPAIAKLRKS